jgi:hypothetical protein
MLTKSRFGQPLSGTLILAAERTGRIAGLIEIDPHCRATPAKRWAPAVAPRHVAARSFSTSEFESAPGKNLENDKSLIYIILFFLSDVPADLRHRQRSEAVFQCVLPASSIAEEHGARAAERCGKRDGS